MGELDEKFQQSCTNMKFTEKCVEESQTEASAAHR